MIGSHNTEPEQFAPALKRLSQGLMTGSDKIVLEAHRTLYLQEGPVADAIVEQLERINMTELERPETIRLAAGLASLLHDIDEAKSRNFLNNAIESNCHPAISSSFNSLLRYSAQDYVKTTVRGLEILEHHSLASTYQATRHVVDWLEHVPENDLENISRIYVTQHEMHPEIYGSYLPVLSVIILNWDTSFGSRNPLGRMLRWMHEYTLYHEIGHHACGHVEGGQDPEHEDEADEYARRLMHSAYPKMAKTARIINTLRGKKSSKSG